LWRLTRRPVQHETLGSPDVEVGRVGLGLRDVSGGSDSETTGEDDANGTSHAASDAGVNCFDAAEADGGGYSEDALGQNLDP